MGRSDLPPAKQRAVVRKRIPSVDEIAAIAAALQDLMAATESYNLFLGSMPNPVEAAIPRLAMLHCLSQLERLLNPRRLSLESCEASGFLVRQWPLEVMAGLPALRRLVYDLVKRWECREICEDHPIARSYAPGALPSKVVLPDEQMRLLWVLSALRAALQCEAAPRTPAVRPSKARRTPPSGETSPATTATGTAAPPASTRPKRTMKPRAARLKNLRELAAEIRRDRSRQRNVPRFLELIEDQDEVTFEDIRDKVHGANVEDDAIRKTVVNARKFIVKANMPYELVVSSRTVLKKITSA
jgi:hypothetical protein